MARLIYSMMISLDGYTEDEQGRFGRGAPVDEEVHAYADALAASVGTSLYGRRMYETMVYWETADALPDQPPVEREWARQWKAAEKIVYSGTLAEPSSVRTRIERTFEHARSWSWWTSDGSAPAWRRCATPSAADEPQRTAARGWRAPTGGANFVTTVGMLGGATDGTLGPCGGPVRSVQADDARALSVQAAIPGGLR